MMTQAEAYKAGWFACVAGIDGRYHPDCEYMSDEINYAWTHGFLDAMEAEEDEEPEPACHGYS